MGKFIATNYISLDGVIEAPGGMEDFEHAGWTFEIDRGPEGGKVKFDELVEAEVQLFGRKTYEIFAASWPQLEDDPNLAEFAKRINTMPKYVYSRTLQDPSWQGTTVLSGEFAAEMRKLKDEVDGGILLAGSATVAQGLIENDLLDELRLMVFPVVLGSGKRLFGSSGKQSWRLGEARTVGDGIQVLTYKRH